MNMNWKKSGLVFLLLLVMVSSVFATDIISPDNGSVVDINGFDINYTLDGSERTLSFVDKNDTLLWVSFDDLSMSSENTMTTSSWVVDRINGYNLSMRNSPSYDINKTNGFYGQGMQYFWENVTADVDNTFELLESNPVNSDFFEYVNDYNNTYTLCVLAKPNPTTYLPVNNQGVGYAGFGTTSSSSYQGITRSHANQDFPQSDADVRFVFVDSVGSLVNTASSSGDISYNKWELSCAERKLYEYDNSRVKIQMRTLRDEQLYYGLSSTSILLSDVGADINAFRIGNAGGLGGLYSSPSFNGIIDEVFVFKKEISDIEMELLFNRTTSNAIYSPDTTSFVENGTESYNIYTQTDTGVFDIDTLSVTTQTPPPEPAPPSIINITSPTNGQTVNYTGFDFVYEINDSDVATQLSFIDDGSLMFWTTFDDGDVAPITSSSTLTDKVNGYELTLRGAAPTNNISLLDGRFGGASYWNFSQPDLSYRYEMTNNSQNSELFNYVNDYQNTFTICAIAKPENYIFANHVQNGVGFAGFGSTASSSQQQGIGMEWDNGNADAGAQFFILDTAVELVNMGRTTTQDVPFNEWSIFCGVRKPYNETHFYHYPMAIGEIAEFAGQEPTLYSDLFTGGYIPISEMGYTYDALRVGTKGAVGGSIVPGVMSGTLDEVFIFSRELSIPEMTKLFQSSKGTNTLTYEPGISSFGQDITYSVYAKDSTGYTSNDTISLNVSQDPLELASDDGVLTTSDYLSDSDLPLLTNINTKPIDTYSFFTTNQEDILMWVDFENKNVASDSSWVIDKINGYNFTKVGSVPENITLDNNTKWGQGVDFDFSTNPDISEHYIIEDNAETSALFDYINDYNNNWTMCVNAYSETYSESTPHGQYGQGYLGFGTSRSSSSGYGLGKGGAISGTDRYSFHYLSTNDGLINRDIRSVGLYESDSWDVICGQQYNYNSTHFGITIHVATQNGSYENVTYYIDKINPESGSFEVWDNLKIGSQGMLGGSIAPGGLNGKLDDIIIIGKTVTEAEVRSLLISNETLSVDISDKVVLGENNYTVYGGSFDGQTSIVDYTYMYTGSSYIDMLYPYKADPVETHKNSCVVYQRDTETSGSGRVVINASEDITGLEYSFNEGPWTAATTVDENGLTVFNFTGDVGWGTLRVRAENVHVLEVTKDNVGIGETFVASGQSNGVVYPATGSEVNEGDTLHCIWQGPTTCSSYTDGYWAVNNDDKLPTEGGRDYSRYSLYKIAQDSNIPIGTIGASQCGTGILGWQNTDKRDNYEYNVEVATNGTNKIQWHLHAGSTSDAAAALEISDIDDHQSWINSVHSIPVKTIYQIPNFQGQDKSRISNTRYLLGTYYMSNDNVYRGPAFGDIRMHWTGTYVDLHFTDTDQKTEYYDRWHRVISDAVLDTELYTPPTIQGLAKDVNTNTLRLTFDNNIHTANWNDPYTKIDGKPEGWKITIGDTILGDDNITDYKIDGKNLYLTLDTSVNDTISITYPDGASPWYNYDDQTEPFNDKLMIYSTTGQLATQIYVYDTVTTFDYISNPLITSANGTKFIIFSAFSLLAVIIIAAVAVSIINIFNEDGFDISELLGVTTMAIGLGIVLIIGYVIIALVSNGLFG